MSTYVYSDQLKSPDDFFSPNARKLEKNIKNMSVFADLLTNPTGKANKHGDDETLGDRYFIKTVGSCYNGGEKDTRYMFINNEAKSNGLLGSLVDSLNSINIDLDVTTPACKCVKGVTRDNNHTETDEYRFISDTDFERQKETGILEEETDDSKCEDEGFTNRRWEMRPSKDPFHKMYITSITLLGAYILFTMYSKRT